MTVRKIELIAPAIERFAADLTVDTGRFVTDARALIEEGPHGHVPFGTTTEANFLSVEECISVLDALIERGIDPRQLIPGTGFCTAADTISHCRPAQLRVDAGAF